MGSLSLSISATEISNDSSPPAGAGLSWDWVSPRLHLLHLQGTSPAFPLPPGLERPDDEIWSTNHPALHPSENLLRTSLQPRRVPADQESRGLLDSVPQGPGQRPQVCCYRQQVHPGELHQLRVQPG